MERDATALLYPGFVSDAPYISHGVGSFLYDMQGRDYLDACAGAMTASIGHGRAEIAEAAARQMRSVAFAYRAQWRNEPAERLAGTLVALAGDKAHAFFMNSGSEANEAAYRIALRYHEARGNPGKRRVLARAPSNHGNTIASLSIGWDVRRHEIDDLVLAECARKLAPPYCYRCPGRDAAEGCEIHRAADVERALLELGPETVAAIFIEPVTGALGGALTPPPGYLPAIRALCDRHDVLLIADEVVTGFGRLGSWFGMQAFGVHADIAVVGKGLSGGYAPLSGILLSRAVGEALEPGRSVPVGHTHSGNPMCAEVGNAVIAFMQEHRIIEHVAHKGARLDSGLRALAARHEIIGDVRGAGLLRAVEIVADPARRLPAMPPGHATSALTRAAREEGLIVYPCRGLEQRSADGRILAGGDAVLFAPPLTISEAEIDLAVERFDRALARLGPLRGHGS